MGGVIKMKIKMLYHPGMSKLVSLRGRRAIKPLNSSHDLDL
jgi:hypothetical protein